MGTLGMVLGPSGSGKSTSMRNLGQSCKVFAVTGKRPPFRDPMDVSYRAGYREIYEALKANERRCYVIDDSTYLMQFDNFRHAKEKGYDKFVQMALSFETLLEAAMGTDEDTTVYFLHHPQFGEDGGGRPQTVGKMLDNQLNIEGLFSLILETGFEEGRYVFWTNRHGLAHTPLGLFEEQAIDNDLAMVDDALREHWGMRPRVDA